MKKLIYLGLIAILTSLSACSGYNYYTAAINKTNLSNYHTFAWMPPAKPIDPKRENAVIGDAKIKDAATIALTNKGLHLQQNHPDLLVSYATMTSKGLKTYYYPMYYDGFYPGWGFGYGWGGWYRPYYYAYGPPFLYYGGTAVERVPYKEGTLVIDLIDANTRHLVWRGFGVGELHNPQKTINDLPKVVNGIIKQLQLTPVNKS